MTESQVRKSVVSKAASFIGSKESNGTHKKIIDGYNAHEPLARGYKVKYTDNWCATFVSYIAILLELTDIIPIECSCEQMIKLMKKKGIYNEDGRIVPEIGDIIFYNWDDKTQSNDGWSDHVGIVEKIAGNTITVIEGNYSESVKRRNVTVGYGCIRGYGKPKYEKKATVETSTKTDTSEKKNTIEVGDIVKFVGKKHYANSYSGAKSSSCKSGQARVTAISKGSAHPYHLVAVSGKGSNVYGWVDAKDIDGEIATSSVIKVGDTVSFTGTRHYASSYAGAKSSACKGGKAKVTAINKNGKYKYHLVKANGSKATVHGWVKASEVSK